MFFTKLKKNAGVTLVELMVAVGVFSVVAGGVSVFLSQQQLMVRKLQQRLQIRSIARLVERTLQNPAALRASADYGSSLGNGQLKKCLRSQGEAQATNSACSDTDFTKQVSFDLLGQLSDSSSITTSRIQRALVSGEDARPALYRLVDGAPCSRDNRPDRNTCNVEVRTYFWATCAPLDTLGFANVSNLDPGNLWGLIFFALMQRSAPTATPTTCLSAQSIHLRYQIRYVPGISQRGVWANTIDNYPPDEIFYDPGKLFSARGAITLSIAEVPRSESVATCPPNYTMTGMKGGEPICKCLPPHKLPVGCTGTSCSCTAAAKTCASNYRYRGTDATGNILCCPVWCQNVPIDWSQGSPSSAWVWNWSKFKYEYKVISNPTLGCGPGGWIESVTPLTPAGAYYPQNGPNPGSCAVKSACQMGKWGGTCSTPVSCTEQYSCCYESGGSFGVSGCNNGI